MDSHLESENEPSPFAGMPCYPTVPDDEWPITEPPRSWFDNFAFAWPKLSAWSIAFSASVTLLWGLVTILGPCGWIGGGIIVTLIVTVVVFGDSTWRR